jgi:hypothetical protein
VSILFAVSTISILADDLLQPLRLDDPAGHGARHAIGVDDV